MTKTIQPCQITYMKKQRILGILWTIFCGIPGLVLLWQLSHDVISVPRVVTSPRFCLATLLCLLYLAGAVAGISLFRCTQSARRFVGVVAFLILGTTIVDFNAYGPIPMCVVVGVFVIVSLVLLLLPRHDTVA